MTPHKPNRPRLLTAGYLPLDMIVRDLATGDYWHSAGGTCGNVSIFSAALDIDVSLLARVGKDPRGRRVLDHMNAAGVNTHGVQDSTRVRTPGIIELIHGTSSGAHHFTHQCPLCASRLPKLVSCIRSSPYYFEAFRADWKRVFYSILSGAKAAVGPLYPANYEYTTLAAVSKSQAETNAKTIDQFDAFFFDRATPSTISLAAAAREAGLIVMFEPPSAPRTDRAIHAAELSDIVKISRRPGSRLRNWSLSPNASTNFIIETLGPQGTRFCTRLHHRWTKWKQLQPFPATCVRDTAGAGDWLSAGLLTYLLNSTTDINADSFQASIKYGQKLSSISIAFDGPHGVLNALGPFGVQKALSSPNGMPPKDDAPQTSVSSNLTTDPLNNHCELCLSEND